MTAKEIVTRLNELAGQLETIRQQLEKADVPADVLGKFKTTVDNLRITLWAALSLTESDLSEGVAHFRLKRTEEMCQLVGEDIQEGRITVQNPDLAKLHTTLKDTLSSIEAIQPL